LPAPPKLLGIESIHVLPGGCPSTFRAGVRLVRFGRGWYPPERDANGGVFRWMGSRAKLTIGVPGVPRSAMTLSAKAASLLRPRVLTVRMRGATLQRIAVRTTSSGSRARRSWYRRVTEVTSLSQSPVPSRQLRSRPATQEARNRVSSST
jgi:hypothetical protein